MSSPSGYNNQLGLFVPNRQGVYATPPELVPNILHPHIAVITGWQPAEKLDGLGVNVLSSSYQPLLGALYILWGLARRTEITDLIVVGHNLTSSPSGADVFLRFSQIKEVAFNSQDYHTEFTRMFSEDPILKKLYELLVKLGWADRVSEILMGVRIHNHFRPEGGSMTKGELLSIIEAIEPPEARRLSFTTDALEMPENAERPEPLPQPMGPIQMQFPRQDFPQSYLRMLKHVLSIASERGDNMVNCSLNVTFAWQDPDRIPGHELALIGLDPDALEQYYPQVIPMDMLGRDGEFDPRGAAYLYLACIFGEDAFPVSKQKELEGINTKAFEWLRQCFKGTVPQNQVAGAIQLLLADPLSKQAVISVYQGYFHQGMQSPPCLNQIQLLARNGDTQDEYVLDFIMTVRSHDIAKAYPSNILAIMKLMQIVLSKLNPDNGAAESRTKAKFKPGNLIVESHSAHIYRPDIQPARQLVEQGIRPVGIEWDPLGHFEVSKSGQVVVVYLVKDGVKVEVARRRILNLSHLDAMLMTIYTKYPNLLPGHKAYIAAELARHLPTGKDRRHIQTVEDGTES